MELVLSRLSSTHFRLAVIRGVGQVWSVRHSMHMKYDKTDFLVYISRRWKVILSRNSMSSGNDC
jgi:hypothetical protein